MANADFNRLMDQLRVRLPGALDGTLKLELFSTVDDFLQSTNCWQEEVPFEVNPSEKTYYVFTIANASITRLMEIRTSYGSPVSAKMPEPGTIQLHTDPAKVETYVATVSLTITDPPDNEGYPEFPEWILGRYANEILDGVLGRMMSQIAKPYSQPQLASFHMKRFSQAIGRATAETIHGNVYRGQRWSFPQTFASRRKLQW
jgi:hypothetical protein